MSTPANRTRLLDGGSLVYERYYSAVDPATTNDAAGDGKADFEPGITFWINTTTFTAWLCVDNTKGAAKWAIIGDDTNVYALGLIVTPTAALLAAGFVPIFTGPGYIDQVLDQTLTPTAVSTDLSANIPTKSVVLNAQLQVVAAITAVGNSVKLGLGPVASPVKYCLLAALTKNTKVNNVPALAILAAAEDVQVNAVQTDGTTIGTGALVTGSVRVRLVVRTFADLPDAP